MSWYDIDIKTEKVSKFKKLLGENNIEYIENGNHFKVKLVLNSKEFKKVASFLM